MGTLKPEAWEAMLAQMEREGVGFYLDGKPSHPEEIVHRDFRLRPCFDEVGEDKTLVDVVQSVYHVREYVPRIVPGCFSYVVQELLHLGMVYLFQLV